MASTPRVISALAVSISMWLSGCSVAGEAPLAVPDDSVCTSMNTPQVTWFGVWISNRSDQVITIQDVSLVDPEGLTLVDSVYLPEVVLPDGTHTTMGVSRDPATESPDIWAARVQLVGAEIQPGEDGSIGVRLAPNHGALTGRTSGLTIDYRVTGESTNRQATSLMALVLGGDC